MQRKHFSLLVGATVIAIIAAAIVIFQRLPERQAERRVLLPELAAKIDAVAAITIHDGGRTLVVRQAGDGRWVAPAKANYPADAARVRKLVLGLATLKVIEEKTSNPELYPRLGVEDVTVKDAKSRLVELQGGDGKTVAALLVGKRVATDRAYVRVAGAAQSYLVAGAPEIDANLMAWLDDTLLTVEKERVKRLVVRPANGAAVAIFRDKPDGDFQVENMPKGRKLKSYGGADVAAASLNFLTFDDVRPAATQANPTTVTVTAFDGLTVTAAVADGWVHFVAAHDASAAEAGPGVAVMPKAPADGAKEAAAINARLGAWDYKLPDYKIKDLTPGLEDLLEPKAEKAK